MSSEANRIFTDAFEKTKKVLEFNPAWSNNAGSFDYAVYGQHAPKLAHGEMVKSVTPGKRRILLIGTRVGNLVIFDQFKDNDKGHVPVFRRNCPSVIEYGGWFSDTTIGEFEMAVAVGTEQEGNLGWRLEQLWSAMKKTQTQLKAV